MTLGSWAAMLKTGVEEETVLSGSVGHSTFEPGNAIIDHVLGTRGSVDCACNFLLDPLSCESVKGVQSLSWGSWGNFALIGKGGDEKAG